MAESTVAYKCPNCKAPLSFKPGDDKVTCEYCGTEIDIATVDAMFEKEQERAAKAQAEKEAKWATEDAGGQFAAEETEMMRQFTCSACGAALVADGNTMATECVYCGNPTMVPSRFDGMIKPDYVIPFKKDKKEAVAALKKFYEGKILLPNAFKSNNRVQDIQSMYVPFWLFDSTMDAALTFKCEKIKRWEDAKFRYVEHKYYRVYREGTMRFENVPVDGSDKVDNDLTDSLEPFDPAAGEPYQDAFMAGYLAQTYERSEDECVGRAHERMESSAVKVIESTVPGYDRVSVEEQDIQPLRTKARYALLPVWLLNTTWQDKKFHFAMNGQTGRFVGNLPRDDGAYWRAFAGFFVLYFVLSFVAVALFMANG